MASVGKMAAIGEEGQQLGLCDLPDEILIRILSLLPIKSAVRTCLLLMRSWQHLWKSLTRLVFVFDTTDFVDRVMDLRDHSMTIASFCLVYDDMSDNIRRWITKAVQCNVEELTLSVPDSFYVANSPYCCMFGCQSLVKLNLEFITFDVPSSVICLPRLKYLRLTYVQFDDDESTEKLLSSPLLEELIIEDCSWNIQSIHVCSPKLQVLKIDDDDDDADNAKICVIGDNLKYFSYMGNLVNEYQICASSSMQLSKVEIYVNKEIPEKYALNCYNILKGLSGTPNLALSDYFLEGLQNSSELLDAIPIFECLTRLNIQVYKKAICVDSLGLMKIYERCPHLEYLNIGKLSHTLGSSQLSLIPLCFRIHLKKILVHYYVPGDVEADAAIDVLLNSAFVLEELVIYCKSAEEKGFHESDCKIQELQDKLNRRPRVSKDCIISVRGTDYIERSRSSRWKYYNNI